MKRANVWLGTLVICVGMTFWGGCGDDDGSSGNNNNGVVGDDAAVDAGPDAATGVSVDIIVLDGTDPEVSDASAIRLQGATVAFDLPGGERVERTTGPDGRVTIYGIDWSLGTAAITVYQDGFGMFSVVDVDAAAMDPQTNPYLTLVDGALPAFLMNLAPPDPPELSVTGTATGMEDPSHDYSVFAARTDVTTQWTGAGHDDFQIVAPANAPFTILATEITQNGTLPSGQGNDTVVHRAMEMNMDPMAGPDLAVELDFEADQIPVYTADASIVLPTRADSPLRDGVPYLFVGYTDGWFSIGWGSPVDISADGNRFEGQIAWVEPSLVVGPFGYYMVAHSPSGAQSVAREPGYPQGAPLSSPLYDVARWINPSDLTTAVPLHDPLEWELFNDCPLVVLNVSRSGILIWRVRGPQNATTMTVPLPPSTVNVNSFLGPSFRAQIIAAYIEPDADNFDRYTESPIARLSRE